VNRRDYDAIVLDLDGTLLDDTERIPEGTFRALQAARRSGVRVMIATGRSELATTDVLEQLELDTFATVYNGAAVYCPKARRLVEERVLSNRTTAQALDFAREESLLVVTMHAGGKNAIVPRDEVEYAALRGMHGLVTVPGWELPRERLIRITFFASGEDSGALETRVRAAVSSPVYLTHFPLSMLVSHATSPLSVVDLHAPCRGKAESLRVLEEQYGIPAARVVAVGDAANDLPMIEAAGLGVAMSRAIPEVRAASGRVIGDNNTATIGELVHELFGPFPD
jgi:hypothetical protein